MADEVESMLAGLERRLRALQLELDEPESAGTVPAQTPLREGTVPAQTPLREGTVPAQSPLREGTVPAQGLTRPPAPADPLDEFGDELRRLVASFDRIVAELRGPPTAEGYVFTGDVAIDAAVDFEGLCALGRALEQIGGVATVDLRAYAGGRAALDVTLRRPLALVEELRRTVRAPVALIEAREGRLAIEVGSVAPSGPESGP